MRKSNFYIKNRRPIFQKMGFRENMIVKFENLPSYYFEIQEDMPDNLQVSYNSDIKKDIIHCFVNNLQELETCIKNNCTEIKSKGMIWISYEKTKKDFANLLNEKIICDMALSYNLINVKSLNINSIWSAIKFVYPKEH